MIVSGDQETHNFDLGRLLLREEHPFCSGQAVSDDPWIEKASYDNRVVRVEHAEGIALTVNMLTDVRPTVLHHTSQFANFSGSIRLDRNSNRYINATFFGAKGSFVGHIYNSEKKEKLEMVVTISGRRQLTAEQGLVSVDNSQIKDYTTTITVPSEINNERFVCFYPMGDEKAELCKWFSFDADQLNDFRVAHEWQTGKGDCLGCNERGIESIFTSLDPRSWFDGINSPKEAMAMAIEVVRSPPLFHRVPFQIVLTGVMLLTLICLCTKCFIPLARCTLSVPRPPKK